VAYDVLGKTRAFKQFLEVDAGADPHFLAHEHKVLGAYIAGGAFVPGERAATQTGNRGIEHVHTHFEAGIRIRNGHTAGVVQMQADAKIRDISKTAPMPIL
jgi:hypothetical protein